MAQRSGSGSGGRRVPARLAGTAVLIVVVVIVLVLVLTGGPGARVGRDVSYPQCPGADPGDGRFGIVGVDGGLANNANPCLARQLRWARSTPGQRRPGQPRLSLYIDTSNPGTQVSDWPHGGRSPAFGSCNAKLTDACSYLYGEQRGLASYRRVATLDAAAARTAPWWLDVELMASWAGTYELNIAALQGFVAGLHAGGADGQVGIYSTAAQWRDITGLAGQSSVTAFDAALPDWIAGTQASLAQARQSCAEAGFTGAAPTLAQYQDAGGDADLRCGG